MRLGGVVHAARALWATGQDYAVGAFCPGYLVEQAPTYLTEHGCQEFVLLGEVIGAPNVIAIADVREVGHQGYEDILRDAGELFQIPITSTWVYLIPPSSFLEAMTWDV